MSLSALDRVLLQRADEQVETDRTRDVEVIRDKHGRRATGTCECGRPVYRAKNGRCAQCNQRLRDRSAEVLAQRREAKRAQGHSREEVVAVVRTKHFGATAEDVAAELGVAVDAASQALIRAMRDGWLRRIERGRYGLGPKARQ